MPQTYKSDWYTEPCSICMEEQIAQIILERYGKTKEDLEAEGRKISGDQHVSLCNEAKNRCVKLNEKNEDRYIVRHENNLERAMHIMMDRTGSAVFPFPDRYYVLCPYHRIQRWGVYSATLCTMIYSAVKIQKRVRHSDFEMFGIDRKTISQCLRKAEKRLNRYKSGVALDAKLRAELEKEKARIEKAKKAIFGEQESD